MSLYLNRQLGAGAFPEWIKVSIGRGGSSRSSGRRRQLRILKLRRNSRQVSEVSQAGRSSPSSPFPRGWLSIRIASIAFSCQHLLPTLSHKLPNYTLPTQGSQSLLASRYLLVTSHEHCIPPLPSYMRYREEGFAAVASFSRLYYTSAPSGLCPSPQWNSTSRPTAQASNQETNGIHSLTTTSCPF